MSDSFEFKVLQKLEAIENQVAKIPLLENRMENMENRMENMENRMETMENRMDNMEAQIDKISIIEEKVENIDRALTLLESNFADKVPALFDGYTMHQDNQINQQKEIKELKEKVKNNDVRISVLEQKII